MPCYSFFLGGFPYRKKGHPYSNLSIGGPSSWFSAFISRHSLGPLFKATWALASEFQGTKRQSWVVHGIHGIAPTQYPAKTTSPWAGDGWKSQQECRFSLPHDCIGFARGGAHALWDKCMGLFTMGCSGSVLDRHPRVLCSAFTRVTKFLPTLLRGSLQLLGFPCLGPSPKKGYRASEKTHTGPPWKATTKTATPFIRKTSG